MGILVRERTHEAAVIPKEQKRGAMCVELDPEPPLPCGWEKCLDLQSGLIYFKDWNTGTQTYRDPRQNLSVTQRIGLLSISLLSHVTEGDESNETSATTVFQSTKVTGPSKTSCRKSKRNVAHHNHRRTSTPRLPLALTMGHTTDEDSSDRDNTASMDEDHDYLDLSLNLPGLNTSQPDQSVCTVEKVRNALQRSQWSQRPNAKRGCSDLTVELFGKRLSLNNPLSTVLAIMSPRPSSSGESNSFSHVEASSSAKGSSPSASPCSSECLTSPSAMSYQDDEEEVQQPARAGHETAAVGRKQLQETDDEQEFEREAVMVAVGCKHCLMYVMLSKQHPSCPKCGNTDVLLDLAHPMPKRQRMDIDISPTLSWLEVRSTD